MEDLSTKPYTHSTLEVGTYTVQRGGLDGQYTVTETLAGQFKQVQVTFEYESFNDLVQLQLQTGISNALR